MVELVERTFRTQRQKVLYLEAIARQNAGLYATNRCVQAAFSEHNAPASLRLAAYRTVMEGSES